MRRALALARRGQGRVEPNPMVGCVLVKSGRIIAEGYHQRFGGPHAEVVALRKAGAAARGSTAYVTLEPCSHFGKTPPCCDALIAAGVARVVAAHLDPYPEVAGRGVRALRKAGIEVEIGLLDSAAKSLNAPYLTRILLHRPYVLLKWAQSADGKIATRQGDSQWISGQAARKVVHRLRARVDAIAAGIQTVLRDDPLLTAREVPLRRVATRVIFDSRLRLPLSAQVVRTADAVPTLVLAARGQAGDRKRLQLESRGVEVVVCPARRGRVDVRSALRVLYRRGSTNLLVEGGGELNGAFVDARLVDEAWIFSAPLIVGGRAAPSGSDGEGCGMLSRALRARAVTHRALQNGDLMTRLQFSNAAITGPER